VKSLLRLAIVPLAAIGLVAAVAGLRRGSISETPGSVVEKFLDHLSQERYERAATLLAGDLRKSATPADLEGWQREALRGFGRPRRVRGETEWISGSGAEATGVIEAGRRDRRLRFGLGRDGARWGIVRLDDFWADATRPIRIREAWRRSARPADR
jgi:hypothetical protein